LLYFEEFQGLKSFTKNLAVTI